MIACGEAAGRFSLRLRRLLSASRQTDSPLAYGATDVDLITGTETSPHITQSETFTAANPDNPDQIVVAYNDSRGRTQPINISGASVSTDGGTTFTRLTKASGQSPFDNTFGDPVVLYNKPTSTWFTVWLDAGCGGQGLGGYKSTTPGIRIAGPISAFTPAAATTASLAGPTTTHPLHSSETCTFPGTTSLIGGGALQVRYSTDNGLTWTNAAAD